MPGIIWLAAALVAILYTPCAATVYYVDPLTGSDSNSGLTEASAWKTSSKVGTASVTFQPGDIVKFRRGTVVLPDSTGTMVIRSNGAAGAPIVFTDYLKAGDPATAPKTGCIVLWAHIDSSMERNTIRRNTCVDVTDGIVYGGSAKVLSVGKNVIAENTVIRCSRVGIKLNLGGSSTSLSHNNTVTGCLPVFVQANSQNWAIYDEDSKLR